MKFCAFDTFFLTFTTLYMAVNGSLNNSVDADDAEELSISDSAKESCSKTPRPRRAFLEEETDHDITNGHLTPKERKSLEDWNDLVKDIKAEIRNRERDHSIPQQKVEEISTQMKNLETLEELESALSAAFEEKAEPLVVCPLLKESFLTKEDPMQYFVELKTLVDDPDSEPKYKYESISKCFLVRGVINWKSESDRLLFLAYAYLKPWWDRYLWHNQWLDANYYYQVGAAFLSGNLDFLTALENRTLFHHPLRDLPFPPNIRSRLFSWIPKICASDADGTIKLYLKDHHANNSEWLLSNVIRYGARKILKVLIESKVVNLKSSIYGDIKEPKQIELVELIISKTDPLPLQEHLTNLVSAGLSKYPKLIKHFLDNGLRFTKGHVDVIAALGHLDSLSHIYDCQVLYPSIDVACSAGHVQIVEFVHKIDGSLPSSFAIETAAAKGHLEVIEFSHLKNVSLPDDTVKIAGTHPDGYSWIRKNLSKRYSDQILANVLAHYGRLEALMEIHNLTQVLPDYEALKVATIRDHVKVMEFALNNGSQYRPSQEIQDMLISKHQDRMSALFSKFNVDISHSDMKVFHAAVENGLIGALDWVSQVLNVRFPQEVIDVAAINGHFMMIDCLAKWTNPQFPSQAAIDKAATLGHHEVIRVVNETLGTLPSKQALVEAAMAGHAQVIRYVQKQNKNFWLPACTSHGLKLHALDEMLEFVQKAN